MKPPLHLPRATADLAETAHGMHVAMVRDLLGDADALFLGLAIVESDGAAGAPAWTEADGQIQLTRETAAALAPGAVEPWAVEALAHQLAHSIGAGPAFAYRPDAMLEEALAETILQSYRAEFMAAFGVERPPPAVEAFAVACDRLRQLAGDHDPVELALVLKPMTGFERMEAVAQINAQPTPFDGNLAVADIEATTLLSTPPPGATAAALASAHPLIAAAVHRSLDLAQHLGWARDLDSAARG